MNKEILINNNEFNINNANINKFITIESYKVYKSLIEIIIFVIVILIYIFIQNINKITL